MPPDTLVYNTFESRADVACAHCGLPVPPGFVDGNTTGQFCCAGCHTAFGILHAHGLDQYYRFAHRRETPVRTSGRKYEEFDHPSFAKLYVTLTHDGLSRIELYVEGVHCSSCVWLVERLPLLVPGVARAELDVRRSLAVVEWEHTSVPLSSIAQSLDALGYPPHPFRGVVRDTMRKREDRAMLVRIGVAGAVAINVMLASLALYSGGANGMDAQFERFFRWVCLLVIVPTFLWPGRVFFTGAWAALRTRSQHMDLPIAIALAAGLVRGAINTVLDHGPVYFDGLAVLIFALLVGRFLQQRGQRMAADAAELLHALAPSSARIVEDGITRDVPTEALLPGMVLDVRAGESFAADGVVIQGTSSVNAALLTGESRPTSIVQGTRVFAGTLNVEAPLRVRVEEAGESSRIAKLLRQVEESVRRRAPVVQLANRMAGIFVAVVLTLAVVVFAVGMLVAPDRALDNAIALLIVTCPCALALATPLAITVAVGRAAGRGMLVKGGDALELLATPATLVLDKTGTLTEGRTALVAWVGPEWVKPFVLALEAGSSHPLADGFRRAWPDMQTRPVHQAMHVSGGGMVGTIDGRVVRVGSPAFVREGIDSNARNTDRSLDHAINSIDRTLTPVHIAIDDVLVAAAGLGDRIRDDALVSLQQLRTRGWRTIILSGDAPDVVASVGRTLGFGTNEVVASATPEEKLAFIEALKANGPVVMVGDGVNDAAAIAAATVGIGVHGGAEACLATADIYLARPGLGALVELTDGAQRTMHVIKRNIAFSIAYNVIGAALAATGLLTPLIAAILMPASSITVVLASWYSLTFARSARQERRV